MAIKLFLKHLLTSIRRRPAQPLLLVVVLALAVTVCIATLDIETYLKENNSVATQETYGNAEYTVSVNSFSSKRFMLVGSAKDALPQEVDICGTYSLPILYGQEHEFVYGVATDFDDASKIFDFDFLSYKKPTEKTAKQSLCVTSDFASEHNLQLSDAVKFSVLGQDMTFRICGISAKKFMGAYSAMINIQAIAHNLGKSSMSVNLLADEFTPAGTIYINTNGCPADIGGILHDIYPDMTITNISNSSDVALEGMEDVIFVMVVASVFFVIIVIYCCFHILSVKRAEETALFYAVGAKDYMLNAFSALEMAVYWAIGGVMGIGLSLGVGKIIISLADLNYCTLAIHLRSVLIALACMFVATETSLGIYIATQTLKKRAQKQKKQQSKRPSIGIILLSLAAISLVASVLCCTVIPRNYVIFVGVICLVLIGCTAFFAGKFFISYFSKHVANRIHNKISLRYAMKNVQGVPTLGNIAGLVALALIIIMIVASLMATGILGVIGNEIFLQGDYLVINASENSVENLQHTDGVENVYRVYKEYVTYNNKPFMLMATDNRASYSQGFVIDRLPEGNEVFLNIALCKEVGLELGDLVEVTVGSTKLELKLAKIVETNDTIMLIDAKYWGIPLNYILVDGKDGYDKSALYNNILKTLEFESVTVIKKEEFTSEWVESLNAYIVCAELIVTFIVIFSVIGTADSIISSYRSRKEEFNCYQAAGMNKKTLHNMKAYELLVTFGIGVFIFLLLAAPAMYMVYKICESISISLIWSWKEAIVGLMAL